MTYDYGNARVAGMRGRLLDRADLQQLALASDPAAFGAALGHFDDWRPVFREMALLGAEADASLEPAIERHRGEQIGLLPRLFDGPARRLVEALVMVLDQERVLAAFRRRRGAVTTDPTGATPRGALLDAAALWRLARAPGPAAAIEVVAASDLIARADRASLVEALEQGRGEAFEALFIAACDRSRDDRTRGGGSQSELVRSALARERADRAAAARELRENGPLAAAVAERALALARFDRFARVARRDPLGIGMVMGYVAAIELQAIRLRAVLARVRGNWPAEALDPYLGASGGR
jgi:hypothetical protein